MSVYQSCDIRGNTATELSVDLYEAWGHALGRQLSPGTKFVVGGDVRESTPRFLAALVEGLCQTGLDVVNLGQLPAPMIHYARRRLQAGGCAIVTGGHAPASENGLRWMLGDRPPTPADAAAMQRATGDSPNVRNNENGTVPFDSAGQGRGEDAKGTGPCFRPAVSSQSTSDGRKMDQSPFVEKIQGNGRPRAESRTLDISFDYVACLQETFVESMLAERFAVLDPMFGCWADRVRRYLHAIFPRCVFSTVHDAVDPRFYGHSPDCSHPRELEDLCKAVYRERAHLGVAFDGDGDGVALVDNEGVVLRAEEAAWVLLQCMGEKVRGRRFVHDPKFSERVSEAARQLGVEPLLERSGHDSLLRSMIDSDAVFGAESAGHFFFHALGGDGDGLYAACLVIAHLARSGQSLAELRRGCPPAYMTPDLRIPMPAAMQPIILEQIRAAWAEFPQQNLDGLRIDTPCGWALVGHSETEPEPGLTFRFEALDWHALDDLVERFCRTMPEHGDELRQSYAAAMGGP